MSTTTMAVLLNSYNDTIGFFNHPFFIIVGGVSTLLIVLAFLYKILCSFFGITPILFKLGSALWRRKIAIFASKDMYSSLENSLADSGVFKKGNITHITKDNIDRAKEETVFLVEWETFGAQIQDILQARKNQKVPVIIYAKPGAIPHETMNEVANKTNIIVVNFRGRLLNDILTSLITSHQ
jgi:hypothetical protein